VCCCYLTNSEIATYNEGDKNIQDCSITRDSSILISTRLLDPILHTIRFFILWHDLILYSLTRLDSYSLTRLDSYSLTRLDSYSLTRLDSLFFNTTWFFTSAWHLYRLLAYFNVNVVYSTWTYFITKRY
jgi:hypothetical protein